MENIAAIKSARKRKVKRTAKHLPYKTAEEIEDALAALWILKRELDFREDLVTNAIAHMQAARGGGKK